MGICEMNNINIDPTKLFLILSDKTRLTTLFLIKERKELCVCKITDTLKVIQPKTSRHLAILKLHGIVCGRRDGIWIYYRINENLPLWVKKILDILFETIKKEKYYKSSLKIIKTISKAPCMRK